MGPIGFVPFRDEDVEGSISGRFAAIAAAHPDRPALITEHGEHTYRALAERVGRIGAALAGGDSPVAIVATDPLDVVASILGTLSAGRVYVPLDPVNSPQRLRVMLEHSGADVVLTDTAGAAVLAAGTGYRVRHIDDVVAEQDCANDLPAVSPDSYASLLYTSGSTGRPKGVVQNHCNILFHIRHLTNTFRIGPADRHSLVASFGFDASTTDMYCALLNGAALVPIDVRRDGLAHLGARLREHRVSLYHSTPTVFRHVTAPDGGLPDLRMVLLGGEPVTRQDRQLFRAVCPDDSLFVNGYGATETAGFTAMAISSRQEGLDRGGVEPIGLPVPGVELLLRDASGHDGDEGELFVRSAHLGVGYWRDPEATAAAFGHERVGDRTVNVYRTGDHGRREADGQVVLLGRRDGLVKIHGHRVELPEVESALATLPSVRLAAVVARHGELVAYVCRPVRTPGLGTQLADLLPGFMVPRWIVDVDRLPLTANGKLDVAALPEPGTGDARVASGTAAGHLTSTTERELAAIWQTVLGVDCVGVDDNFYDVGGSSLLFARVHAAVEERFRVDFPARRLFEHPTVRSFAAFLDDLHGVDDESRRRIENQAAHRAAARLAARGARRSARS